MIGIWATERNGFAAKASKLKVNAIMHTITFSTF